MTTAPMFVEKTVEHLEEQFEKQDATCCLICRCKPILTLCGKFNPDGHYVEAVLDDTECKDCYAVWRNGCPHCGCRPHDTCASCQSRGFYNPHG